MASIDVCVPLRRGKTRVTQQLLDGPKVGASLQEMRREAVPQGVGADSSRKCHSLHALCDEEAHGSIRETAPPRVDEQGVGAGTRLGADWEIGVDGGPRSTTERHDPFLSAFTQDSNHSTGPIDLPDVQSDELGAADPRGIEELEDSAAPNRRVSIPRHLDQEGDVVLIEVRRHPFLEPG